MTPTAPGVSGNLQDRVKSRFSLWLTCGLALGILPVMANYLAPLFTNRPFSMTGPLADGELLISSTAIAGAAIGELFQTRINDDQLQAAANVSGGLSILFCTLCALAYALVRSAAGPESPDSHLSPVIGSLVLFGITMYFAGRCIRLAAEASGV